MKYFGLIILFLQGMVLADVKGLNGQIGFDPQSDDQADMILNSTGLGIGTIPSDNLHVHGNAIITEQLFIGSQAGSANLNLEGSLGFSSESVNSSSIIEDQSIYLADSSSDNLILKLPYAGNVSGRVITVKKTSTSNKLWLVAQGGNLIDDERSIEFPSGSFSYASVISNGTQWYTTSTSDSFSSVASDNLVGWWKLDEITSSNLINQLDLYPSLVFTKSNVTNSDPTIGAGLFDQAVELDGTGDNFYMLNSNTSMDYFDNATQISMSIWFKINDLDNDQTLISKGAFSINNPFLIWRDEEAAVSMRQETFSVIVYDGTDTARFEAANNQSINTGWHHIVVTYQGGSSTGLRFYLDGIEDLNSPVDTSAVESLNSNANYFRIGRSETTNELNGSLDEFRIFNRVLTPTEIQTLYAARP